MKTKRFSNRLLWIIFLSIFMTACVPAEPSAEESPSLPATETVEQPTVLPVTSTVTATALPPTITLMPSSTPEPPATATETLMPLQAPIPSNTPEFLPIEAASATVIPTNTTLPLPTESIPIQPSPTIAPTETSEVEVLSEESGVEGRVELGAACGNLPTQGDVDCSNTPYQAYLTITDLNGQVVVEGLSNADGSYRFNLAPGDYILIPEKPQGPISADHIPFSVTAGNLSYVTVLYDTMVP